MKKHFFVYCFLLLSQLALFAQKAANDWYTIKAFPPAWNKAKVELILNGKLIYTDTVRKDLVSYTSTTSGTQEALLKITLHNKKVFLPFFIEPGTIKIRDEGHKLAVSGTPSNNLYGQLNKQWDSLALLQKQSSLAQTKAYKRTLVANFIQQTPGSPINTQLLSDYFHLDYKADDTLFFALFNTLDSQVRHSFTGKKLQVEVAQRFATAIGRQAPLLLLPDTSNLLKPIYEKGSYTLINFWASWCMPCRREHPALLALYNKYPRQLFTIVGISIDNNRSAWTNGIKREKLTWQQLSDPQGWNSPAAKIYGVNTIPNNLLLGPDGKVVGKNLSLNSLEQLLEKHLTKTL